MSEARSPGQPPRRIGGTSPTAVVALVAAAAAVVVAVLALVVVLVDDDGGEVTSGATTTTAVATTTTSEPATTTSEATTTTTTTTSTTTTTTTAAPAPTAVPAELTSAVWPWYGSDIRYDDPVEAVRGFAVEYLGFDDPLVGELLQGDSRSGEVEIRATTDGAVTTVFVRELAADGNWWVIGSATADIVVDQPEALSAIDDPMTVAGQARAFEGTVFVELRVDGDAEPLAETVVTASGDETLGPFQHELDWPETEAEWGAVVFFTRSAENDQVWEAGVVRVRLP